MQAHTLVRQAPKVKALVIHDPWQLPGCTLHGFSGCRHRSRLCCAQTDLDAAWQQVAEDPVAHVLAGIYQDQAANWQTSVRFAEPHACEWTPVG